MFGQLSVHTIELQADQHLRELRRESEQHRLAKQVQPLRNPVWSQAAFAIGYRLVGLGEWLMARPTRQPCPDQGY